jgi:RNA polymerase sigma-70 factor (ECF subfamily)
MTLIAHASAESDSSTSVSLLRRVRQQDPEAWRRLVDLYGPLVFYWGRRSGLSAADAADVLQEVFVAVYTAIGRFERGPQSGTFRGWLWTITRNKVRDHFRRSAGAAAGAGGTDAWQQLEQLPEHWDDDPADSRDRDELSGLVRRATDLIRAEFEDRTWQAFWRTVIEEQPTDEVARELGLSANAVRQYKSRVLRRLRQELGDLDD